jgi:glycosyltransferase involved in cell wall biosynthesis
MKDSSHRFAFVVPTRNRPDDLRKMLQSVESQSVHPEQIIIVDGGEDRVEDVVDEFPVLNLEYVRVIPPSLSKQRNAGMQRLHRSITLAGYLDDDLFLEDGAMEAMLSFWESVSEDVGGAAFNIVTDRRPHGTGFKSFYLAMMSGIMERDMGKTWITVTVLEKSINWL